MKVRKEEMCPAWVSPFPSVHCTRNQPWAGAFSLSHAPGTPPAWPVFSSLPSTTPAVVVHLGKAEQTLGTWVSGMPALLLPFLILRCPEEVEQDRDPSFALCSVCGRRDPVVESR